MRWLRIFFLRLRTLFLRRRLDEGLDREISYHLDQLTELNKRAGMSQREAHEAALREIGGLALTKDECRDARRTAWLDHIAQDLSHGLRLMWKQPGFAMVVAATFALGIGANTILFSVADALTRKATPFAEPDRLQVIFEARVERMANRIPASPGNYADWRVMNTSFQSMGAYLADSVNLSESPGNRSDPERLRAARVDGGFFETLGVQAVLGRTLDRADTTEGKDRSVVISHGLWQRRFGGDPGVLGAEIEMNDIKYSVAGVMPPGFAFPDGADVWRPLAWTPAQWRVRLRPMLFVFGRLKPDVTAAAALAEMSGIAMNLERAHPDTNKGWRVSFVPMKEFPSGPDVRRYTLLLSGVVGLVLLIACANVANLLLTRVTGRFREIALRQSLGASRARLTQQLLTEGLVLSFFGAALGIGLAYFAIPALRASLPSEIARSLDGWESIQLDGRTLLFSGLLAILTGIVSGVGPVWLALWQDPNRHMAGTSRASSDRGRARLRNVLVAGEITLAIPLLIGALLMVRGFLDLWHRDQGYRPESLLTFRVDLPQARYSKPEDLTAFYDRLLERLRALPGVESAFASNAIPHSGRGPGIRYFSREGDPSRAPGDRPLVVMQLVSLGYLRSMRIPLMLGRDLSERDDTRAQQVAVISNRLAREFWPSEDPIGKRLKLGDANDTSKPWITIVGVAGDVVHNALGQGPQSSVYLPMAQAPMVPAPMLRGHIGVRATSDPQSLARAAQRELQAIDPELPAFQMMTMEELRGAELIGVHGVAWIMGALSTLALLLAAVGVYSMMAYAVAERTREFGIRLAIGASSRELMWDVFRRGLTITVVGLSLGVCIALAAVRIAGSSIAGMASPDLLTFLAVAGATILVALAANLIPARRATRVDPAVALRAE